MSGNPCRLTRGDRSVTDERLSSLLRPNRRERRSHASWNARVSSGSAATQPNFLHVKAGGNAKVGAEEARTYQFSVMDASSHQEVPLTLYVSASSGLPLKIEMNRPEGSMGMEYYDVNAPLDIPIPDCLKK